VVATNCHRKLLRGERQLCGNLFSEAKHMQLRVMNASGGMHRKFSRREPIVFKKSSIPPRTAGRPQATVKRGETIRTPGHWPRAQPRQPNVSCRPALARALRGVAW
jgi:hypothetical protein